MSVQVVTAAGSDGAARRRLAGTRPALVRGVVLLATFVINLDTTIVNVASRR